MIYDCLVRLGLAGQTQSATNNSSTQIWRTTVNTVYRDGVAWHYPTKDTIGNKSKTCNYPKMMVIVQKEEK